SVFAVGGGGGEAPGPPGEAGRPAEPKGGAAFESEREGPVVASGGGGPPLEPEVLGPLGHLLPGALADRVTVRRGETQLERRRGTATAGLDGEDQPALSVERGGD